MVEWNKLLLAAGGAAGVAAVVYFLKEKSDAGTSLPGAREKAGIAVNETTKEQVRKILQEVVNSQEQMKGYLKELTQELIKDNLTFEQTYKKVKEVQPDDPLETYGLSIIDFDQLLEKYESDPNVGEALAKIKGTPNPNSLYSEKVQSITVEKIIEVHEFMLVQLKKLKEDFQALPDKSSYDQKTVTITAQAIVSSTTEQKFGLTSEDIENAVHQHHTELLRHMQFASININIQIAMNKLM